MLKYVLHTGLAVPNLEDAIKMYQGLGFEVTKRFQKADLDADVAMVTKDKTSFELFQFNNPEHPQVQFIRNHIAIYSDDLETDVNKFIEQDYELTIPVTEGVIYRFAFLRDKAGTNYEIATDKN